MNTQANTPNGTGGTVHDASDAIASLLSAVEDDGGTQTGSEAAADESHEEEDTAQGDETDTGEEGDGEDAESGEQDEDEGDQPQELPDDTKIKVGDEEVTLHELRRGFLREQDYTRKTQALADERRNHQTAADNEMQALRGERAQLAQALGQAQQFMAELTPKEPDWDTLYRENPAEYAAQRELWRSWQEQQAIMGQRRQALAQQEHQTVQQELQRTIQSEKAKLLEALPEWKKPEVARAEKAKMLEWGLKNGFTEAEFSAIIDHRPLVTVRKAMLYDELMAKKASIKPAPQKKGAPKPSTPGSAATSPTGRSSESTRAKQRLAQTGRVSDAASAIASLLPDDF